MNFDIIQPIGLSKRIKKEISNMIDCSFCNLDDVQINKKFDNYDIKIKNKNDNRLYIFTINSNYPFIAPKLTINNKPYSYFIEFKSTEFRNIFQKYTLKECFCCNSILCSENWTPNRTLMTIFEEVELFHNDCLKIAHIIISNVIKRKYLIYDINITQWLV